MYVHCTVPLVVQSYTIEDDDLSPLTPRICTALNGNFLFDLYDIFQECKPGFKTRPAYQKSPFYKTSVLKVFPNSPTILNHIPATEG